MKIFTIAVVIFYVALAVTSWIMVVTMSIQGNNRATWIWFADLLLSSFLSWYVFTKAKEQGTI